MSAVASSTGPGVGVFTVSLGRRSASVGSDALALPRSGVRVRARYHPASLASFTPRRRLRATDMATATTAGTMAPTTTMDTSPPPIAREHDYGQRQREGETEHGERDPEVATLAQERDLDDGDGELDHDAISHPHTHSHGHMQQYRQQDPNRKWSPLTTFWNEMGEDRPPSKKRECIRIILKLSLIILHTTS
jgi:hypothetical protein